MDVRDRTVRILHVDDERDFAAMAAEYLQRERDDFDVVTETDAAAAPERLHDRRFDSVVSDYDMPGMDGIELLETVREDHPDLPFVLFTGKGTEEIASEAISAGVTDYLQKGTSPDQYTVLANRIGNAVERYRTEQRAERHRRINRLINEVNQSLIRASSRRAIEESTCRILDDSDPYEFACVTAVDGNAARLLPAVLDEEGGRALVESVSETDGGDADVGRRAVRERTIVVADDVDPPGDDPWKRLAAERGCPALAVVPLSDEDGRLLGVLAVYAAEASVFDRREQRLLLELGSDVERAIREVQMRNRLRRTKERFQKVFDESNDAIMLVDMADEAFLEVNPAACEMLGYDREELLSLDPEDIHPDDIDRVREEFIAQVLEEGSGWTDDLRCLTRDGETVPTEISGGTLELDADGPPTAMVAILRDISERETYRRELEAQLDRLDEFASVLSHDLRNPLNVATGQVDLALEGDPNASLAEAQGALERMDRLIDQSLTLARGGRTVGDTEPVALSDVVERCWGNVVTGDATLRVEDPPTADADRERLQQLFENLFRNAVEHGSTSSRTESDDAVEHGEDVRDGCQPVTIRVGAVDGGFYVEDDGPGIPPEEREDVLQAGYTTTEDGTGLGLAIVRRVAEAHGWTVDVTESGDGGARFEFTGDG